MKKVIILLVGVVILFFLSFGFALSNMIQTYTGQEDVTTEINDVDSNDITEKASYYVTEEQKEQLDKNGVDISEMQDSKIVQEIYGNDKYEKYSNMTKYNEKNLPEFDLSRLDEIYNEYFAEYKKGNYEILLENFSKLKEGYAFTSLEEYKLLSLIDDTIKAKSVDFSNADDVLHFLTNHKNPETLLWDFHKVSPKVMGEVIYDNFSAIPIFSDFEVVSVEEIWPSTNYDLFIEKKGYESGSDYLYEITYVTNTGDAFVTRIGVLGNGTCTMIDNYPVNGNMEDYISIRLYNEPY